LKIKEVIIAMVRFIGAGITLIVISFIFFLMVDDGLCRHGVKQRNRILEGLEDAEPDSLNSDHFGANKEYNASQDNGVTVNSNEIQPIGVHSG